MDKNLEEKVIEARETLANIGSVSQELIASLFLPTDSFVDFHEQAETEKTAEMISDNLIHLIDTIDTKPVIARMLVEQMEVIDMAMTEYNGEDDIRAAKKWNRDEIVQLFSTLKKSVGR